MRSVTPLPAAPPESRESPRAKAAEEPKATVGPTLTMSDQAIRRRTGRGWEEWFDLLDEWGAPERSHRVDLDEPPLSSAVDDAMLCGDP